MKKKAKKAASKKKTRKKVKKPVIPNAIIQATSSESPLVPLKKVKLGPKLTKEEMEKEAKEAKKEAEKKDILLVSKLKGMVLKLKEKTKRKEKKQLETELKSKIKKLDEKKKKEKKVNVKEAKKGIINNIAKLFNPKAIIKNGVKRIKPKKEVKQKKPAAKKQKFKVTRANYSSAHKKLKQLKKNEIRLSKERARKKQKKLVEKVREEEKHILEIYSLLEKLAIASAYRRVNEAKKIYSKVQNKFKELSGHGKDQARPVIEKALSSINKIKK